MSGELLEVEAAQATVLAGVEPLADVERIAARGSAGPGAGRADLVAGRLAAAVGQLRDGRLRGARGGRRRRRRGPARAPDGRRRVAGGFGARRPRVMPRDRDPDRDRRPDARRAPMPWSRSRSRRRSTPPATRVRAAARRPARCRPRASSTRPSASATPSATRGSDVEAGATVVEPGVTVTPAVVALASGAGLADVVVRRRPIVAVLATGDEVRAAGHGPRAGRDPGRERPRDPRPGPRGRWGAARARHRSRPAGGRRGAAAAWHRRGRHRGRVGRGVRRAVRRRAARVRHRRPHQPVARRRAAGQAVRLRPCRRRRAVATPSCCSACRATPSRRS